MRAIYTAVIAGVTGIGCFSQGFAGAVSSVDFDVRRYWVALNHDPFKTIMACYQVRTDGLISAMAENKSDAEFEEALIGAEGYEAVSLAAIGYCNALIKTFEFFPKDDPAFFEASDALRRATRQLDLEVARECSTQFCSENAEKAFVQNTRKPTPKE